MIIDSHQHFWNYKPVRDTWINENMGVLRRDFMPKDLSPLLSENKVVGSIAVQADQSEEETLFLLKLANQNNFIKGVVGWVDLLDPDVENRLAYFSEYKKFKGLRHILQAETEDFILRKDFHQGIASLQKFDLVYDILIYPNQLVNTIQLVNSFPNQIFVLDHLAKPNIKEKDISFWEKHIALLAKSSNVYCKISGMVTEADWNHWTYDDFVPYLDIIVKNFGVDRILFGSDWPVCLLAAKYDEVIGIIEKYIHSFSEDEKFQMMGQNALKVYALEN